MSKMFETLGPLGQEWCFSKIMDSAKTNIQVKKAKIKNKKESVTKKIYLPKIYEPTMEPLSSLSESTNVVRASGILFKIE